MPLAHAYLDARAARFAPSLLLAPPLAVIALALIQPYVDPRLLFIDAVEAQAEACCGPHLGAISNLGVALMALACAAALMAMLRAGDARMRIGAGVAAFASAALALADFFRWHEVVGPAHGVPEFAVQAGYGVLALICLALRRAWMAPRVARILVAAVACLAASAGLDGAYALGAALAPGLLPAPALITAGVVAEDGAKLIGIWLWLLAHAAPHAGLAPARD